MREHQAMNLTLFFLRVSLGLLFTISAWENAANPAALYQKVANSHLLPPPWDAIYARALPWWEAAFALCFFLGLLTRLAGLASLLALASYTVYVASNTAAMGFFGPIMLSHDLAFLGFALAVSIGGAGNYAIGTLLARPRAGHPVGDGR